MRSICLFLLLTLIFSACGNKGPLYLPEANESTYTIQDSAEEE